MKFSLIYNPNDHKLSKTAYSQTYRDMFLALIDEFNPQHITKDCSAKDIDGDVLIFYDPHSSHHIKIDGLDKHSSIKMEYMNDPHQLEMVGEYLDGVEFHKLGAGSRCRRSKERGIDFIISPYKNGYYRHLAPYLENPEKKLVWFPPVPAKPNIKHTSLMKRLPKVLANGHTGTPKGMMLYEFRKWAFAQSESYYVRGCVQNEKVPKGKKYMGFLSQFAGAMALCDMYTVPKYFEIPLSGTVCFAQWLSEYYELGFRDCVNCVYVDRGNFTERIRYFKENIDKFQKIADAGRKLVEEKYTAKMFAKFIRNHIEQLGDKK